MPQSTTGRIWNWLASRYEQDEDADCCGTTIEEVSSDTAEADSENCCE
jgi:hypothetical protein